MIFFPVGGKHCLQWCLPCYSKAASCLNVCKWNYVLKLTLPFVEGCSLAVDGPWLLLTQQAESLANLPAALPSHSQPENTQTYQNLTPTWNLCDVSLHLCSADGATMWGIHLAWGKFIIQQHFAMVIRRFTLTSVAEVEWRHNSWTSLAKGQPKYGKAGCRMKLSCVPPVLLMLRHAA